MQEEFHALRNADNIVTAWKQLYGWGTITANVWLPSMSELVGIDPNNYADGLGAYYSAMQGLNASIYYYTDVQGDNQFAYFQQFNASSGGEKIWNACRQESSWLRSPCSWETVTAWQITTAQQYNWVFASYSSAVHPAVSMQVTYHPLIPERTGERSGLGDGQLISTPRRVDGVGVGGGSGIHIGSIGDTPCGCGVPVNT